MLQSNSLKMLLNANVLISSIKSDSTAYKMELMFTYLHFDDQQALLAKHTPTITAFNELVAHYIGSHITANTIDRTRRQVLAKIRLRGFNLDLSTKVDTAI